MRACESRIAALALAAVFVATTPAWAQGEFVARGFSVFSAATGAFRMFDDDGGAAGLGASAGVSIRGSYDVELGWSRGWYDDDLLGDLVETETDVSLAIHVLKQTETMPVSLYFGGSYFFGSITGDGLDREGLSADVDGRTLTVGMYRWFVFTPSFYAVPIVRATHSASDVTVSNGAGLSGVSSGDATSLGIAVSLVDATRMTRLIILTPAFAISEEGKSVSIALRFALVRGEGLR